MADHEVALSPNTGGGMLLLLSVLLLASSAWSARIIPLALENQACKLHVSDSYPGVPRVVVLEQQLPVNLPEGDVVLQIPNVWGMGNPCSMIIEAPDFVVDTIQVEFSLPGQGRCRLSKLGDTPMELICEVWEEPSVAPSMQIKLRVPP